jgi:alginate O-acetyltransferase complex protein AlgI
MVGAHGLAMSPEVALLTRPSELVFLALGCVLSVSPLTLLSGRMGAGARAPQALAGAFAAVSPLVLLVLCTLALHARSESPFLYFQF